MTMESQINVTLYGAVQNNAVVKLPGRAYPGVVVQSDTLGELASRAKEVFESLIKGDQSTATEELAYFIERLDAMLLALKLETQKQ